MEAVRTFFSGNKTTFSNEKQQTGFGNPSNNNVPNSVGGGGSDGKTVRDIRQRLDSDSYFYIMWRS